MLTSCNPRDTFTHTPTFTRSCSSCLYNGKAGYCHFDACFYSLSLNKFFFPFFFNEHTDRLSSKPSTPTPPCPRWNVLNISKKINDFFSHSTGQHGVNFFIAYVCAYLTVLFSRSINAYRQRGGH